MAARARTLIAGACAAAAAAGCGTGADAAQVRATSERFAGALGSRDGAAACAQLTPALRERLAEGGSCEDAVMDLDLRAGSPAQVRVYASAAEVGLAGGERLILGAGRLGWRMRAVGCRPQPDGTYDCEEEA